MSKSNQRTWAWIEATKLVPFLRHHLAVLRTSYVQMMHLHFRSTKARSQDERKELRAEARRISTVVESAVLEITQREVLIYQRPWRGIALFPFRVQEQLEVAVVVRDAFWVFKDSRTTIGPWVLAERLAESNDLFGEERSLPDEWKQEGGQCLLTHQF